MSYEITGKRYTDQVVEMREGDTFAWCRFENCEFIGPPAKFVYCAFDFTGRGPMSYADHERLVKRIGTSFLACHFNSVSDATFQIVKIAGEGK